MSDALPPANTVPVIDTQSGEMTSVASHDLEQALNTGFRQPSPDEMHAFQMKQQFGTGIGNEAKAFGAGAARGATFGLSDQALTKSGLVNPETLSSLQQYNPVSSGVGELAGVVAPALLSGGLSAEVGAAAKGAVGAAEATGLTSRVAGAIGAPVGAISKAGAAITEAATPLAEKAAGLLVNPETSPLTHKILSQAGAHAVGSAVEGAAYGLGQSVSEQALGDPDLNGEKVFSNIGMNALLGGTFGAAFGGGAEAIKGIGSKVASVGEMLGKPSPSTFEDAVTDGGFTGEQKKGVLDGLKSQKSNATDIKSAADELGVGTFIPQTSDSETVQRVHDTLLNSPTHFGEVERQKVQDAVQTVSGKVQDVLSRDQAPKSLSDLGEQLKTAVSDKITQDYAPTKALYDKVSEIAPNVPIDENAFKSFKQKFADFIEKNLQVDGTAEKQYAKNALEALSRTPDLGALEQLQKEFNQYGRNNYNTKFITRELSDGIEDLRFKSVKNFAENITDPTLKSSVTELIDASAQAKSGYAKLRDKMSKLGKALGKNNFHGPQDFLNFLEDGRSSEQIAEKLFKAKNSEFTNFFRKNFPNEWEAVADYQKNKIFQANLKDGSLNVNGVMKSVSKLEPEMKSALFNKSEQSTLDAAKTYMDAFPKKFNPSGTAHTASWMSSLQSPVNAAITSARDYAITKGFQNLGLSAGAMSQVSTLSKIERTAQAMTKNISQASKFIFNNAKVATLAGASVPEYADHNKIAPQVTDLVNNPAKLQSAVEDSTSQIFHAAPNTASSVQMAAVRATNFLGSKIPKNPNPKPFSAKFVPSGSEIAKFNRYYQTIQHPVGVLHGIKTGMIMPEQMETLSNVYPSLLQHMQVEVTNQLTNYMAKDSKNPIPYKTKMALSMFLGQDLDSSLDQMSIASNQMLMTGQGSPQDKLQDPVNPSQSGMKNLSQNTRSQTNMQSIASGGDEA